jgi:hypothetical protein
MSFLTISRPAITRRRKNMACRLDKVVSGGQTGADRAGLDAAMEAGIPVGGYCPKGRLAEDGTVPDRYPLTELTKGGYPARTEKNVVESDGTLILNMGKLTGGTKLTAEYARKHSKPLLIIPIDGQPSAESVITWISENNLRILNVAGPRESKCPGLQARSIAFLREVFSPGSNSIVTYDVSEEGLIVPTETPPPGWMGTWTPQDTYRK